MNSLAMLYRCGKREALNALACPVFFTIFNVLDLLPPTPLADKRSGIMYKEYHKDFGVKNTIIVSILKNKEEITIQV